ncbi:MAG: type I-E CRISPR-associated protein Cse2/CasB, partial [Paracoccaceae bacterium]
KAQGLGLMVRLLAEVRTHDSATLAQRLGGGVMSELRFQQLMRAEGDERDVLLHRAILIAERRCNVAALAWDLRDWNDKTRTTWCFHYFGADAPSDSLSDSETDAFRETTQ